MEDWIGTRVAPVGVFVTGILPVEVEATAVPSTLTTSVKSVPTSSMSCPLLYFERLLTRKQWLREVERWPACLLVRSCLDAADPWCHVAVEPAPIEFAGLRWYS